MAGPDGGRVWEKAAQLPALSREHLGGPLQQLWRYTHPNLHACTSPYRHIYIYMFVQELDLLVGWGSRKWGDAVLALSGRAGCRLSPLESFDPRYQRAGVTRLSSSL